MGPFVAVTSITELSGRDRRYLRGRCFCYWQDGPRANGTVLWGKPLEEDIADMTRCWDLGDGDPAWQGHVVVIDARAVEAVDALAFGKLLSYLVRTQQAPRGVGSLTMVHSDGLVGVVTAGLLNVVQPLYPFRAVTAEGLRAAFVEAKVEDLYEPVEALRLQVSGGSAITFAVQAALHQHPRATAPELADHLGLSERTLQRRLVAAGSSLRHERQHYLLLRAEELLAGTSLDLDAIAAQLGLASASHLVAHFRRAHDMTPGEWRKRNRR